MNIVAYFFALANMQSLGGHDDQKKDLFVKVADVVSLAEDLKQYSDISLNDFKKNNFCRQGNTGIYISKNLWNYLFDHGSPDQDGVIIKILYSNETDSNTSSESSEINPYLAFLIKKGDYLNENEVNAIVTKVLAD